MKNHAWICAALVVATIPTGAFAASDQGDPLARVAGLFETATGGHLDITHLVLVARRDFSLPPGAVGVRTIADWSRGAFQVGPLSGVPKPHVLIYSGCVLAEGGSGWAALPVATTAAAGGCGERQVMEGGVFETDLACVGGSICGTDLHRAVANEREYALHWCVYDDFEIARATWPWDGLPSHVNPSGRCFWFETNDLDITRWESYDALVMGTEGSHVGGFVNYV